MSIRVIAFSLLLLEGNAWANGVFPNAGQIVVDPTNPNHLVVQTTYGLISTQTENGPWDWTCESAIGYGNGYHPPIALTQNGTLITGLDTGLAVSMGDMCSFNKVQGALDGPFVTDVSVEKSDLSHVVLVTAKGSNGSAQFWTSDNSGVDWKKTGSDLLADFNPLSIDVAKTNPLRVYVSNLVGTTSPKGSLLVSDDRGQTWMPYSVPKTDGDHGPFIGAVDPNNADRVYIRNDGIPGRLYLFDRATGMFTLLFAASGTLRGLALSPDGGTLLVGGSSDGIWRANTDSFVFEKSSEVGTRCLTWEGALVYTCANEVVDGFTVGVSTDSGATFEPILHQPCIRGPLDCPKNTGVGMKCPPEWDAVALQIGHDQCAGGGGNGGGVSAGGSGAGGSAGVGGNVGSGGTSNTGTQSTQGGGGSGEGGQKSAPPLSNGCACSTNIGYPSLPEAPEGTKSTLLFMAFLAAYRRTHATKRRAERRPMSPHPK